MLIFAVQPGRSFHCDPGARARARPAWRAARAASRARERPKMRLPPSAPPSRALRARRRCSRPTTRACPSRDGTTPPTACRRRRTSRRRCSSSSATRASQPRSCRRFAVSPCRATTSAGADDGECGDGDDDDDDARRQARGARRRGRAPLVGQRGVPDRRVLEQAPRALLRGRRRRRRGGGRGRRLGDAAARLLARGRLRGARAAREGARRGRRELGKGRVPSDSAGVVERGWQVIGPLHKNAQRYLRRRPARRALRLAPRADKPPRNGSRHPRAGPAADMRRLARGRARRRSRACCVASRACGDRIEPLRAALPSGPRLHGRARSPRRERGAARRSPLRRRQWRDAREDWASGEVGGLRRTSSPRRTTTPRCARVVVVVSRDTHARAA